MSHEQSIINLLGQLDILSKKKKSILNRSKNKKSKFFEQRREEIYTQISNLYLIDKDYENAIKYKLLCVEYHENISSGYVYDIYRELCEIYGKIGNELEADKYGMKAYYGYCDTGQYVNAYKICIKMIQFQKGNNEKIFYYYNLIINNDNFTDHYKERYYRKLAERDIIQENYDQAIEYYYKIITNIYNSVLNEYNKSTVRFRKEQIFSLVILCYLCKDDPKEAIIAIKLFQNHYNFNNNQDSALSNNVIEAYIKNDNILLQKGITEYFRTKVHTGIILHLLSRIKDKIATHTRKIGYNYYDYL